MPTQQMSSRCKQLIFSVSCFSQSRTDPAPFLASSLPLFSAIFFISGIDRLRQLRAGKGTGERLTFARRKNYTVRKGKVGGG